MKKERKVVEINPFVANGGTLLYHKKVQEKIISYDGDIDYQHSGTIIKTHFLVEAHRKTSLYCPSASSMDEKIFKELSSKSRDLLLYIMVHITTDQDYIKLPYKTLIKNIGCSRNTIMLALKELKSAGFITDKSEQSVYWVNPMYIFRGNRLKYYSAIDKDIIQEI